MDSRDDDLVALTHVCRVWREVFVSHSSLWTNFDCTNADKTRAYFERSKSSPLTLRVCRDGVLPPEDPFLQITPHSVSRLKSLSVVGVPENLQDITACLTCHAPLLETLDIDGGSPSEPQHNPMLTTSLFNGDLSSLRDFRLWYVRTGLPWRNMANLTSFTLGNVSSSDLSITQLLDFFEGAPRLRNVKLDSATPVSGGQDGRLVSLGCLRRMDILRSEPSSLLLDHLLIPAGVKLTEWVPSFGPALEDYLPRSLDNLRNVHNFTKVRLVIDDHHKRIQFDGPSGRLRIASDPYGHLALGCVVRFNTSKVDRLEVVSNHMFTTLSDQGLLHLQNLRTLTFFRCIDPYYLMANLHPDSGPWGVVACPKLEELIFVPRTDTEEFNIKRVVDIVEARASRGAKLRAVRVVGGQNRLSPEDVLELRKHVSQVEYDPGVDVVGSDSDDSDEEY